MVRTYRNPSPWGVGDVHRIDVFADRKIRYIGRGSPSTHDRRGADDCADPWVLFRAEVPALSDDEWNADPWADKRPAACCASCGQEDGHTDPAMCEVCSRTGAQS